MLTSDRIIPRPAEKTGSSEPNGGESALPKIHDELIGELMVIKEDLGGFHAALQLILDQIANDYQHGPEVFNYAAEGKALQFLLTSVAGISKDLSNFIKRNREEEAAS